MRKIKVKQFELQEEGSWLQRTIRSKHFQKSLMYIFAGGIIGFLYYYFTTGQHVSSLPMEELMQGIFTGAFLGFFLTNSPCARGRC